MTADSQKVEKSEDSETDDHKGIATQLLIQLGEGDESAAGPLFERYRPMLERVAKAKIRHSGLRGKDELDAAQSVIWLYINAVRNGQMRDVNNHKSFENVLLTMLSNKVNDYFKHELRQKRGGGNVTNFSGLSSEKMVQFVDERKTEQFLESLINTIADPISSERGKEIARLLMNGFTRKEAAEELGITERTVYRELLEARNEIEEARN